MPGIYKLSLTFQTILKQLKICICLSVSCASIKSTCQTVFRIEITLAHVLFLLCGRERYMISVRSKTNVRALILCTSAQALTVSIFTDSYRGKVKCQKKIHVQSIYSNLIIKQANKKLHCC